MGLQQPKLLDLLEVVSDIPHRPAVDVPRNGWHCSKHIENSQVVVGIGVHAENLPVAA